MLNSSPPGQKAAILAENIFKCIFVNENDRILLQISLKFVPRSPTDNKWALVQVMAWRPIGDKPLPEPMIAQLTDAYMQHNGELSDGGFPPFIHQAYFNSTIFAQVPVNQPWWIWVNKSHAWFKTDDTIITIQYYVQI